MEQIEQPLVEHRITRKEVRKDIFEKLAGALVDYKDGIKKKKFKNSIKKATKLFEVDVTKAARKNAVSIKKLKIDMKN